MKRYTWVNSEELFDELLEQSKDIGPDYLPNTAERIGAKRIPEGHIYLYQMPVGDLLSFAEIDWNYEPVKGE